jgi:YD repeat-containing protein
LVATNWNALNEMTLYAYNAKGQLTNLNRPSGLQTAYLYFSTGTYAGWLDKTIDYEVVSGSNQYYRTNVYDTANRLVSVRDSFGAVTNTYNNQSLITTASNVLDRLSSVSYDRGDRVTSRTDANGLTTGFGYDDLGRLTTRLVSGTATETNTYSPRGLVAYVNPLGITNSESRTTRTRTAWPRMS